MALLRCGSGRQQVGRSQGPLVFECSPSRSPVYLKDGNTERFFVRTGAATTELTMSQARDYVRERFREAG